MPKSFQITASGTYLGPRRDIYICIYIYVYIDILKDDKDDDKGDCFTR